MNFHIEVLHSGSKGNCYLIEYGGGKFLIECGIRWKEIMGKVKPGELAFCLISHAHKDHSLCFKDLVKRAVTCAMTEATAQQLQGAKRNHNVVILEPFLYWNQAGLKVLPFPVEHDIEGAVGFLIDNPETDERLFYVTDSQSLSGYTVENVTHLMIEINYMEDVLLDNIARGEIKPFLAQRIAQTHLGQDDVFDFLENQMKTEKIKEIRIIHTSDMNINEPKLRQLLEEKFPKVEKLEIH